MLTFQDNTHFYELLNEKNKNKTLRVLTATISHEVITPLSLMTYFAQECQEMTKN